MPMNFVPAYSERHPMRKNKLAAPPTATSENGDHDFLTLDETAERLRCSKRTLRRRIKDHVIRATTEGGRKLISIEDYYAYVERLRRSR
jgi:excisionase family DNA binding protein